MARPPVYYERKPDIVDGLQFTGTNQAEMVAFCPDLKQDGNKLFFQSIELQPQFWMTHDIGGAFHLETEKFLDYWSRYTGPPPG
jgi:hypothetical protein